MGPLKSRLSVRVPVGELVVAAAVAGLGGAMAVGGSMLPIGRLSEPGPGFAPLGLGILLVLLGLAAMVRLWPGVSNSGQSVDLIHTNAVVATVGLVWIALSFERFGSEISLGVFCIVCLKVFASHGWIRALLTGTIASIVVTSIFRIVLGVNLPSSLPYY